MDSTSASLLERLRERPDPAAWDRFVELYTPLLYQWARHLGLQDSDAADLVQEVFLLLLRKLPEFRYDPSRSFRAWLRTVASNRWRELARRRFEVPVDARGATIAELPSPDADDPFWEEEYRKHLLGRALDMIRPEFQPATWQAFLACALEGRPASDVAGEQGISLNAVYLARSRVLRRLRQELHGLMD